MDYILQLEKIDKYLEFNLEFQQTQQILKLKRNFNNDLNLLGGYIKDFLCLENQGKITDDDYIYNDFVLCFEKYKDKDKIPTLIKKLLKFGNYYLTLVFEDTTDRVLLNTIVSVNSCFNMEYYPFLMELIDKYINKKIDGISYALMLQSITDTVFRNFESEKQNSITLIDLRNELDMFILSRGKDEKIAI